MKYALLGRTGLYVSRIALGTMTFGGAGKEQWDRIGALDAATAGKIVGTALEHGVNLIDTADMYADGECEEILGSVLPGRRDELILATKVAARTGPGPNDAGLSRFHLMRSVEASLRRLRTDRIDLYQLHVFDPRTPVEETLAALDDLVRQGKVRYIGVSNFAAWQIAKAAGLCAGRGYPPLASGQAYYSLAGRDIETEIVPALADSGIGLLVYSPLAGGFLSGKFSRTGASDETARRMTGSQPPADPELVYDIVDVLRPVAARHEATVAQVALAWVLAQPSVTSVIAGARRPSQLVDNLGSLDLELSARDLAELDAVSRRTDSYPGWTQRDTTWRDPAA
jgi:aryl-alcohol dehydrogenase-like predicted oxidoreductase